MLSSVCAFANCSFTHSLTVVLTLSYFIGSERRERTVGGKGEKTWAIRTHPLYFSSLTPLFLFLPFSLINIVMCAWASTHNLIEWKEKEEREGAEQMGTTYLSRFPFCSLIINNVKWYNGNACLSLFPLSLTSLPSLSLLICTNSLRSVQIIKGVRGKRMNMKWTKCEWCVRSAHSLRSLTCSRSFHSLHYH